MLEATILGRTTSPLGQSANYGARWASPSGGRSWAHLESTFVGVAGRITCCRWFASLECMTVVLGVVFWITPPAVMKSPKLVEFVSLNPYTYVVDGIKYKCRLC